MKRKISYIVLFVIMFSLGKNICYAANAKLTASNTTITKGNSTTLTVTITTESPMVSIEGKLTCTGAFQKTYDLNYDDSSNSLKSKTYTYTITPTNTGTITCSLLNTRVTQMSSAAWQNIASSKVTITVNTPPTTKARVKSTNNFLSSLTIEGLTLNETFDKELLTYTVTVPAETEKIKINAQVNDSNAKVSGVGEVAVTSGLNTLEIVVIAENGSKRTYTINATVLELNPIEVKIDNETYTLIRKRKDLPKPSEFYQEKDITVGEDKIEGYYYEKLDYTIVGLKDSKGNINYYLYQNNEYLPYNEATFGAVTLRIIDKKLPDNYYKTSFTYNGKEITSYQETKLDIIKNKFNSNYKPLTNSPFYLFYATNLETGKDDLYQYDTNEKTVQRYNTELLDMYKEASSNYYLIILGLILFIIFLIIVFSISIKKSKKKEKPKKKKLSKNDMDFIEEE